MLKRGEEMMNLMMLPNDTVYVVYQMPESQKCGYLLNFNINNIYIYIYMTLYSFWILCKDTDNY